MNDETRRYLTEEVLGECWHVLDQNVMEEKEIDHCIICGKHLGSLGIGWAWRENDEGEIRFPTNRTFTTMPDLIALFEAIHKRSYIPDWDGFFHHMVGRYKQSFSLAWHDFNESGFTAWLFCLNAPEQIPARCQMIADWHRGC